ncbi:MAG: DUF1934 domain-containing protein [Ruminococcus sp.]|nr:DUF1934 domain-containing protein [Ruminococcus sp.]
MKEQDTIKLRTIQRTEDDSSESELFTDGKYNKRDDGGWEIVYEDTEATGFEGSVTRIQVTDDNVVSIIRSGSSNSNLMLEVGKKHFCLYSTPFGDMTMGVRTSLIENKLNQDGGSLHLKYTLDINSAYLSENEVIMEVIKN